MLEGRKQFFCEKKNKTFEPWAENFNRLGPISKSFLLLFFKKEGFFS